MNKNLLLIGIFLFKLFSLAAQCPTDLIINSQTDIDNFSTNYPGCTEVTGSLTIEGNTVSEIVNLNGLNQLETITGDLIIQNNEDLTSLAGIHNLTAIGANIILDNLSDLNSLTALSNLTIVNGNFILNSNTFLTSLSGLENITQISGDLQLTELGDLASLSALSNLDNINGDLSLVFNPDLTNLIGLEKINEVNALDISNNFQLTSLSGLDNLTTVNDYLKINNNGNLLNCTGLNQLTNVGFYTEILSNFALTSLSGLQSLDSINGQFNLSNNTLLNDLDSLTALTYIGFQFNISNNSALTDLNGLENLAFIGGQLEIIGNSSLTTLDGIQNISNISGDVNINGNTNLTHCAIQSICNYFDAPSGTIIISANGSNCSSNGQVDTQCSPAPVDLTEFYANLNMGVTSLSWTTATEIENRGFAIEYSQDGHHFNDIGFVSGAGASSVEQLYFFRHNNPIRGYNYYRLRQVDYSGAMDYSSTIAVQNNFNDLQIYPNPSHGTITLAGHLPEVFKLVVSNIQGKEIMVLEQLNSKTIDLSALEDGVYFVQIYDQYHPQVKKLILKRDKR